MVEDNRLCGPACPIVDGQVVHSLARHNGLRCKKCGRYVTWFNDVPLRGFCWGPDEAEHDEWSALVPRQYNPYL